MKSWGSETGIRQIVEVNWADRWQVYQRLNELDIPCCCETNQPLQVEVTNPQIAVQFWSVMRHFTASRQDLICRLEHCWRIRYQTF
ncbi:Asr1405/Asl0597 family protein [Okeanomitos corallinicola TIOX110]|uniref:Asr1405/Asl0597 family protein n=1 Tax=Okeanomitos corallinicola TIOX110 TaxID=3133117 RepID=A0ABZ2UPU5_9CYAN